MLRFQDPCCESLLFGALRALVSADRKQVNGLGGIDEQTRDREVMVERERPVIAIRG